jgi:hypothetical protein
MLREGRLLAPLACLGTTFCDMNRYSDEIDASVDVASGGQASSPQHRRQDSLQVAVLLPCYNEALAIAKVVTDFQRVLPDARIYVYDNNSSDDSVALARRAGAIVRTERRQGKGFVVRRMFADIEADIYVMCDADDTYAVSAAHTLVQSLVDGGLDMVVAARSATSESAYRPGHKFGNWLLTTLVRRIFGGGFSDMLSGYRVFSRRFVKSFPVMSRGFEVETELTIHALELEMPAAEIQTEFKDRMDGSESKLRTFSDGFRILGTILTLLKQERPLFLFGSVGVLFALVSLVLIFPVFLEFLETGLVPRLPTAVLSTGLMLSACLSLFAGLILDTVTRGRQEAKRIRYLDVVSISSRAEKCGHGRT